MEETIRKIKEEVSKAIIGKDQVIHKILGAILAGGHVLLEDIPGVGKTTLALAFSKAMGLDFQRVQFTPDVVPSDIVGFSVYKKETATFEYKKGAVLCNFFLADEINRTSSKTQSALLEVMQESKVTIDGRSYDTPQPFLVMATQNPLGTAGTQRLPEAQLDRFFIQLSMGYPDFESQVKILRDRQNQDPLQGVAQVVTKEQLLGMKLQVGKTHVDEKLFQYVTRLAEATRSHDLIKLGLSPRGALALVHMAKAMAYMDQRAYVIARDVEDIFMDVAAHRLVLAPKAQLSASSKKEILEEIKDTTEAPIVS